MSNNLIDKFIKQPPIVFPLVALFHIALLGYSIYNASTELLSSVLWLQPVWMLCLSFAWLFSCAMKKWAALVYVGLVVVDIALHLFDKDGHVGSLLYFYDVLFAMILMAYFKRFS
ncbi:MAG: hypothetical protein JST82_12485 [Bacteroidetes bacterium]|nr:hypothetical protein [Bacteroidota bacterium]